MTRRELVQVACGAVAAVVAAAVPRYQFTKTWVKNYGKAQAVTVYVDGKEVPVGWVDEETGFFMVRNEVPAGRRWPMARGRLR